MLASKFYVCISFIYDKIYNGEFKEARIIKLLVFQIIFNLAMKYEERIHEKE